MDDTTSRAMSDAGDTSEMDEEELETIGGLEHNEDGVGLGNLLRQESQARLQAQLKQPLNRQMLTQLRTEHAIGSFYRTKVEIVRALTEHSCNEACSTVIQSRLGKRKRNESDEVEGHWPVKLTDYERREIISNYIDDTCAAQLTFVECSFCGILANHLNMKQYPADQLDITLLQKMEKILRRHYGIHDISVSKTFEDRFANGCWVGHVPQELKGLTFLEEQCIARARCTRCIIKLTPGKYSQYATHGNVCVFPQNPQNLRNVLPPPMSTLYDEVAVIFVSSNNERVTEKMLDRSPLLVRRGKVLAALTWLKAHNVLYGDIEISSEHLSRYPEDGAPPNYPIQTLFDNGGEGTGYSDDTLYQEDANSANFQSSKEPLLQSCGVLDADNQEISYKYRKLSMVRGILHNRKPFVKYPASYPEPMKTARNPNLYALLWPTLFPYGIGVFEEELRSRKSDGFRTIDLKRHVNHVLNWADDRFQKHLTFPFVMMNLLQRRVSSFRSRLIMRRSWFPQVVKAFQQIDVDSLDRVKAKMESKTPIGDSVQEKAVLTLFKYVNYISEDVSGSIGEVNRMRYEIRSIMRVIGLPHLFVTINPADVYNPIMQVFGGCHIDLEKTFDDLAPGMEEFERMKCSVANPAAASRAFDYVLQTLINTLFGIKRPGSKGMFGPVQSYYGVVEAQGRGSLHCHFFVWLKGAHDPFTVKDKLRTDPDWRQTFFGWIESIIYQDLPYSKGNPTACTYKREPGMCRPQKPTGGGFDRVYTQELKHILNLTGQIHEHSHTCFKHLPFSTRSHQNNDTDCRFGLPRESVAETHVDEDGHIHIRCTNGKVNGYNDVIVYCMRCNMDCKYIGSGTMALAMTEYITNYIAKVSMDSCVVFSCLCAALKSVNDIIIQKMPDSVPDVNEQSRLLLLKMCNGLIGKRELSRQQVTAYLQNIPNRYTNHRFENIWWTLLLKYVAPEVFNPLQGNENDYIILHESMLQQDVSSRSNLPGLKE